jgi:two-component system, NtrC family, response regulator AtoC
MSTEQMRILVVDDEEIVRESLLGWLEQDGYTVETAADGFVALEKLGKQAFDILLVDLMMPGMDGLEVLDRALKLQPQAQIILMTAHASVDTAVTAIKQGAYDYLVKPFDPEELTALVQKIAAQQRLLHENAVLRRELRRNYGFHDLVSKSPVMQRVFELGKVAAPSNSTVLILGESGTGKEILARAIHQESPRKEKPFVAVSCAALTETLLESELFGHEKGAFTGATARRKGKFEAADGGTLFLDEIGDITPRVQVDLLRVLEERKLERVGGNEPVAVDVRILAATNRDLKKQVAAGTFREDLYYRLNVICIQIPPLRERREDIPLLVERFVELLSAELKRPFDGVTPEALEALMNHPWPGNVRELRNVLERGAVVAQGRRIQLSDLGLAPGAAEKAKRPGSAPALEAYPITPPGLDAISDPPSLEDVEKSHIAGVLKFTHSNVTQAARILGIDRVTLYNKIKRYSLPH